MTKDIITVKELDSIERCRDLVQDRRIHHLLVENNEGSLVGIISTEDILKNYSNIFNDKIQASHIMSPSPETINENDPKLNAVTIFINRLYRALPVVDNDNNLVGIITPFDLLRSIYDQNT